MIGDFEPSHPRFDGTGRVDSQLEGMMRFGTPVVALVKFLLPRHTFHNLADPDSEPN